jgi:NIPSNAP
MNTPRTFELRTYYCFPGRLPALHKRFQEHTFRIWAKHGIVPAGFFTPTDGDVAADKIADTLIYLISFDSREEARRVWADFVADPEWIEAKANSELDGRIVERVESVFLKPTEYSTVK